MSEITDFYSSWLGCSAFGANGTKLRDFEPINFNPLDISGCALWLDANDNFSVTYNDLQIVTSWASKGLIPAQFDASGIGVVEYGTSTQNGLNTVSFKDYGFLTSSFAFDFQARSVFVVAKPKVFADTTAIPILTSDTTDIQELFFSKNGTWLWFEGKHPSPFPTTAIETATNYTGYANLAEFIIASDLSDNWTGINTQYISPTYQSLPSYSTATATNFLGNYFSGSTVQAEVDYCEIIIYNTALGPADRAQVEYYLMQKWGITEPATPPFTPTDISGLYIWFDANDSAGFTTDASSNILTWKNSGLASNLASNNCNYAVRVQDLSANNNFVALFPQNSDMITTMTLPYLSRTHFAVFNLPDNLSNYPVYPYQAMIQSYTNSAMQTGVSYDTGTSTYFATMCQQGQNCPIVGNTGPITPNTYHLVIFQNDSANLANNLLYFNGGSNINTGTDLGNLFLQTNETYYLNNANVDAPPNVIAEILEYGNIVSASNISTVADYLVNKWAISSFTTIS